MPVSHTIQCTKTGADVYLAQYGEWVHCDAFQEANVLVLNIAGEPSREAPPRRHYTVYDVGFWKTGDGVSVLVSANWFRNGGTSGVEEPEYKELI